MTVASLNSTPANESERLGALRALAVLDTESEASFDALARVAASAFEAPVALISFIDSDRQWIKAGHGWPLAGRGAREIAREASLCARVASEDRLLAAPDCRLDPRFADHPMVGAGAGVRFYAGAPILIGKGLAVGAVSVMGPRPRAGFSEAERARLADIARMASALCQDRALMAAAAREGERRRSAEAHLASALGQAASALEARDRLLANLERGVRQPLARLRGVAHAHGDENPRGVLMQVEEGLGDIEDMAADVIKLGRGGAPRTGANLFRPDHAVAAVAARAAGYARDAGAGLHVRSEIGGYAMAGDRGAFEALVEAALDEAIQRALGGAVRLHAAFELSEPARPRLVICLHIDSAQPARLAPARDEAGQDGLWSAALRETRAAAQTMDGDLDVAPAGEGGQHITLSLPARLRTPARHLPSDWRVAD